MHKAVNGYQTASDAYVRGRPDYPQAALNKFAETLELLPNRVVVDIGAGTGKFTEKLLPFGVQVIAVEPIAAMREKLAVLLPHIDIRAGFAAATGLPPGTADAVIAAQAFHWFASVESLAEIHRILKPGGKLGLIWNSREDTTDWLRKLTALVDKHELGTPRHKTGEWRQAFAASSYFQGLATESFTHIHKGPPSMVVDRVASTSFIAAMNPDERAKVLNEVRKLLETDPELIGKKEVEIPYRTDIYWTSSI